LKILGLEDYRCTLLACEMSGTEDWCNTYHPGDLRLCRADLGNRNTRQIRHRHHGSDLIRKLSHLITVIVGVSVNSEWLSIGS